MSEVSKTTVRIFGNKGEISDRARSLNWSQTSLGGVETWSLSLKTTLSIVFNACNPMFLLWGDDCILFYNDAYHQQLQAHQQSLPLGQSMQQSWLPSWQSIQADIEQIFATGQPLQRENQKWLSDRTASSSFTWSYSAVWDEVEQISGVVAAGYEVMSAHQTVLNYQTDLQQTEAALRESEELKQRILESSHDCIKVLNLDSEILYINTNGLYLLEIDAPTSILHTRWVDLWQGEEHEKAKTAIVAATLGKIGHFQGYCATIKGTPKWWDVIVTPIRNASEAVVQLLVSSRDITEAKHIEAKQQQAERALREAHVQLEAALAAGAIYTWHWHISTNRVVVNAAFAHLFAVDPDIAITDGLPIELFVQAIHDDDRPLVVAAVHQSLTTGEHYVSEYRVSNAAGEERWLAARGCAEYAADGSPVAFPGALADITERKQAEAALQQTSAELERQLRKFDVIASSIPDFIYTFDLSGRFTYANQPLLNLLHKPLAEVLGKNFFDLDYPTELAARLQTQIQQVIETHQPVRDETPYTSVSGTGAYEYILVPLFDAHGAVEAVAGVTRDITDRKQAEIALQESEERFRTLADNIAQFAWIADEHGWIFWYNQRWFDYTGTTLETMQGWGWQQVHHPDHVERVTAKFRRYIETGETWEDTFPLRSKDGEYRWFLSRAIPIRDAEGNVSRWFGTNTDITDRVQLEQERDQLLAQANAAREEAERANRIKDEFLAVLSHELRSPLNPILGWSKLLQQGKLDEARTATALATIERNAKLQAQLIDDLLDISRILQGKLTLNTLPVHLSFVLSAAIETVRLAIDAKAIQLELLLDPDVGQILGDAARLQQVVWNLLSNAAKFTPSGGQITVSLTQVGTCAQIQVKDNGKGIHPHFLPNVFEHFRQEDGATTRQFGGLGLGLAIVRQIVELHGGTVKAESPGEGLGATFTVKLPLAAIARSTTAASPTNLPIINLKGLEILVVDDEADMRELAAFTLKQHGAVVITVASAQEALTLLDRSTPDLLISDIGMAGMDGYMLMQQVRQRTAKEGGEIPAIALTAYAGEFNQQQALAAGFQQHIAKPVEPDVLLKVIAQLLKHKRHG